MKKYIIFGALALLLIFSSPALATEPDDIGAAAAELAALGLLQGDGLGGFDLDAPCNRLHGAVLFTRLLGKEQEAIDDPKPHPFADIGYDNWASPYLGYLYNSGLAYGQAYNQYGSGQMLPNHFATFCLRSLGYTEGAAESDFLWTEALDFMVEQNIVSGTLRSRLRYTPLFTRGDAVLLAHATLVAEMKDFPGQTLLQRLAASGVISPEQAADFSGAKAEFNIAFPTGMLDDAVLAGIAAQNSLSLGYTAYEPTALGEEEMYLALREQDSPFDMCIVPGYLVERLRLDGLLHSFAIRDFGGREAVVSAARENPYWYDEGNNVYYAMPLAFEVPCLYFDSSRIQNPDWSWLYREAYSGSVYMPSDATMLVPLAMHYYNLPYDTADDKKLTTALRLISDNNPHVVAYLNENMLGIAEREGAIFGVISSRLVPELEQRRQENSAYENWRAVLPPSGGPIVPYYAVMLKNGEKQSAAAILGGLMQPQNAAANAQNSGYLPLISGADEYLIGAIAWAYPNGRWERCRLLNLDTASRGFLEQGLRNALLLEAAEADQTELAALEFTFTREEQVYQAYSANLAERTAAGFWAGLDSREVIFDTPQTLPERLVKEFQKEAKRLGLALWKEYYDGPADGASWSMTLTFNDGTTKTSGGYGLPPLWYDLTGAMFKLCAEEAIPANL